MCVARGSVHQVAIECVILVLYKSAPDTTAWVTTPAGCCERENSPAHYRFYTVTLSNVMSLSLKPERIKRYKDLAVLLARHGRSDWVRSAAIDLPKDEAPDRQSTAQAEEFADDLESLGPTFIKLGQLLAGRSDLLPAAYVESLARLQDNVASIEFDEVREIVNAELDFDIGTAFETFDETPIAAASLAQVHRARLRDGRDVVVKVQRPGIQEIIRNDLAALGDIASILDDNTEAGRRYAFSDLLDTFRRTLIRELDYRREGDSLITLANNLQGYKSLVVPRPVKDFTTAKILTMEYLSGVKLTDLNPVVLLEVDGRHLAEQLVKAYLDQMLIDGFFHADPHPGNILLTRDHKLALIDLGMVGLIDPDRRTDLLQLILALAEQRGRVAAELVVKLSTEAPGGADRERFRRETAELVLATGGHVIKKIQVGRLIMDLIQISGQCGIRPAHELTIIGKTLLNLDEITRVLDPDFDVTKHVRGYAEELTRRHMLQRLTPGRLFTSLAESAELAQRAPERISRLLDSLVDNQFEIRIDAFNEQRLTANLQKIANRISMGIVLAALIMGAAMLMRVETGFTILGYPGLAMILFTAAAISGAVLVGSIFLTDRRQEGD